MRACSVNSDWASLPLFDRSGWERVRFEDVVENVNESELEPNAAGIERYIGLEHLEPGSLHVREWGLVSTGTTFTRRCRPGQVLFGKRRAYQRKVVIAEFDAVVSGDIYVFAARPSRMVAELLPFLCLSEAFFRFAVETSSGSLSPRTSWGHLAKFEFLLPPLGKQQRISALLSECERSLEAHREVSARGLGYRNSFLRSLAADYASQHQLTPLDELIEDGRPICYGILKPGPGAKTGIPVVKVRDYPRGAILEQGLLLTTPAIGAPFRRSRLKQGDLLLSIRGTIGRLAEVPPSLEGANITQDTARLTIKACHNRQFVRAMLESQFLQDQIKRNTTGLAVKGINIGAVRKLLVPLPSLETQDRIVDELLHMASSMEITSAHVGALESVLNCTLSSVHGGGQR